MYWKWQSRGSPLFLHRCVLHNCNSPHQYTLLPLLAICFSTNQLYHIYSFIGILFIILFLLHSISQHFFPLQPAPPDYRCQYLTIKLSRDGNIAQIHLYKNHMSWGTSINVDVQSGFHYLKLQHINIKFYGL